MNIINIKQFCKKNPNRSIEYLLWSVALSLILFAFFLDSPVDIFKGIYKIIVHPDGLITDYIKVGGYGATFMNAGLIMSFAVFLFKFCKVTFSGPAVACVFLMCGFSMFGKNIANIWPILLGVYIFSRVQKEPFSKYIYVSFYGTSLSPLITEVALDAPNDLLRVIYCLIVGILIGFALPPLSTYCLRVHQGYNLYNVGFAAGLVGTVLVSVMKSLGYTVESSLVWTYENNYIVIGFFYAMFVFFTVAGFFLTDDKRSILRIYRHSGRLMADFIILDQFSVVLFNMGTLGIFATSYILLIGGSVNGATIGGILTIVGFGAFGKHLRNVVPVVLGVALGSVIKVWNISDPSIQLAALFATGLAPISGQFGWPFGLLAGFIHSSMVINTGILHGGLNLYNNGFSAGLVALILVPIIESLFVKENSDS